MAFLTGQTWYAGSTKWTAASAWAAATAYTVGQLRRQLAAPAAGSERIFVCIVAGTSGGSEPSWVTTHGAKTTDNTVTWQEVTGKAAVNGNAAATSSWNSTINFLASLGVIIKNIAGTHYFICTTAGTTGNGAEPTWNTTAGATTADGGATWTSLGAVGGFSAWGAAAARLNIFAATGFFNAAGDTIRVNSAMVDSQAAAISYNATGSGNALRRTPFLCVDDADALSTGAAITSTGANAVTLGAYHYFYGFTVNAGTGANAVGMTLGSSSANVYENCTFNKVATSAANIQIGGGTGGHNEFRDCAFTFGNAGDQLSVALGRGWVYGGSIAATGTVPTTLFTNGSGGTYRFRGVDISAVSGTLASLGSTPMELFLENCRLHASVTKQPSGTNTPVNLRLYLHNCDSGATNYTEYENNALGLSQSETSVVRTGGASNGTTPLSWLVTTSANSSFYQPFIASEISQWDDTSGNSKTATVEITTDATLTNAECWLEVEYPSSASYPLGLIVTTRAVPLAAGTTLTTSSVTWGGAAKTNKYKISASYTPEMKGPVKARLHLAKPSTTIYVDPLIVIA